MSRGEIVEKHVDGDPFDLGFTNRWLRQSTCREITQWRSGLEIKRPQEYGTLFNLLADCEGHDFLGLLYQSLICEGSKSKSGSYYTPSRIVEDALTNMSAPIETFLDPCCGTGKFLMLAGKTLDLSPQNIYGFDCDPIAVHLARLNLLLTFPNQDFDPNIHCLDSLSSLATGEMFCTTNTLTGKIDAVATNPPWGANKNTLVPTQFQGLIRSRETYSMFILRAIELVCEGGQLSFVLPESILQIRAHFDIRQIILKKTRISRITRLGRPFAGVFTPVIRLDLIKGVSDRNWFISVDDGRSLQTVPQERFVNNEYCLFDIDTNSTEETLLKKIFSAPHTTLQGHAEWALGVVTGNNRDTILQTQEAESEPIFRGSDVRPFAFGEPRSFIRFNPRDFQQVAPLRLLRAPEKLIYKFISDELVFAYDDQQRLTLNSANIVIPSIPGMSIKVALAFLNSAVFQYIFKKKFSTHKVLRGDLEKLPFPVIGQALHEKLETIVNQSIQEGIFPLQLEHLLLSAFGLSDDDISIIFSATRSS
jgi:hypothetical protein